jgi:hypothetical protein
MSLMGIIEQLPHLMSERKEENKQSKTMEK